MEKFDALSKIIDESISRAIQLQRFDIGEFVQKMELGFSKAGFRENNMTGGGLKIF